MTTSAAPLRAQAVLLALALAATAGAQMFDATADFSTTHNPATGTPWSYGWEPLAANPAAFTLHTTNPACGTVTGWGSPAVSTVGIFKNTAPSGSQGCATWLLPHDTLSMHPAPYGERSVLRFTAPSAGPANIHAVFWGVDYAYPTTTDVHVAVDGTDVWSNNVTTYLTPTHTCDAIVTLAVGSTVEFIVGWGPNNNYAGDLTALTATVTMGGAAAVRLGNGCNGLSAASSASLASTPPVVGNATTISITNAASNLTATVYYSFPPPFPFVFATGCIVYVNLFDYYPLLDVTMNGQGNGQVTFTIPADPSLVGYEFILQGLFPTTPGPLGYELTNGVDILIG